MQPGTEDGILNTYAEGILGKYTAEFAGACFAVHVHNTVATSRVYMQSPRQLICKRLYPGTNFYMH